MQYARLLATVAIAGFAASAASADTIATFADPAPSNPPFLFAFNGSTLSGSWALGGLTLETPVLAAPDYANATFNMAPVAVTGLVAPGTFSMGPGSVNFFDAFSNPLLTISFSGGLLNSANFGSSDFIGENVVFSGPILGGNILSNEAFAFSFANQVGNASAFTATSSFTSSATIPAPGAFALVGLGGLAAFRRRR